jgi:hypothetical protein
MAQNAAAVAAALVAAGAGIKLADELHHTRVPPELVFIRFDRALAKSGK